MTGGCHVRFCEKLRINSRGLLGEIVEDVCKGLSAEILAPEGMPDHVHSLVEVDPQFGIHRAVKRIKGVTSRILREEFPELKSRLPTLWTS